MANQHTANIYLTVGPSDADFITDGTADDVEIQQALDAAHAAGGGVVLLKVGVYRISKRLRIYSKTILQGEGQFATEIQSTNSGPGQTITRGGMLYGLDVANVAVRDLSIKGVGKTGTSCYGVFFDISAARNVPHILFSNVRVYELAGDGIKLNKPILTSFDNVRIDHATGDGFIVSTGTSTDFFECYAGGCDQAGFHLEAMTYCTLQGTGSESNGLSYWCDDSKNIAFLAPGGEDSRDVSASYPGTHFKLSGGNSISILSGYARGFDHGADSGNKCYLDISGSKDVWIAAFRGTAASSLPPTKTYKIGGGATVYFVAESFEDPAGVGASGSPVLELAAGQLIIKANSAAGHGRWAMGLRDDSTDDFHIYYDGANRRSSIRLNQATGAIVFGGAQESPIAMKTGAYTLTGTDSIIAAEATLAGFTVTLPTAVGIAGRRYTIKKIDSSANGVTIGTTSSQTIDGDTTKTLTAQHQSLTVVSDGARWLII
jgi:hypothetical protein